MLNTLGLIFALLSPVIILLIVYYTAGKEAAGITILVFLSILLIIGLTINISASVSTPTTMDYYSN